jgi:hypothetical protein
MGRREAGNERGPDAPRVGRKRRHELWSSGPHDFPIRPGVRHDEHQATGGTDRNLGAPPPAGSDPRPEARQEPKMGDIPNRRTGGIGTRAEIETDDREHGGHPFDGSAGRTTSLDAAD